MKAFLIILTLSLLACNDSQQSKTTAINNNITNITNDVVIDVVIDFTILALGDSLTEGLGVDEKHNYPSILQDSLPANIKVINAGLSGETSSGLKNRLNWVLKQEPKLVILNIGANDAMRGLPLELTKSNIDSIIISIKDTGADVILAGMQIYDNLGKEYVAGFSAIYPELAQKHDVPLIPFFLAGVAGDPEFNQKDMLHPNAQGYKIIVEANLLPVITRYLKAHKILK